MDLPERGALGVVSDLHGNAVALEAVATHLAEAGVDAVVCLGDVAATGPRPHEVLARLRQLAWPTVLGNADAWLLDPRPPPADADAFLLEVHAVDRWCAARLDTADRAFLRGLPRTLTLRLGPRREALCFHGSPRSYNDLLVSTTPEATLDEAFAGVGARLWLGGHSHQPLLRRHRDALLVNPGSVGVPYQRRGPGRITHTPPWAELALVRWSPRSLEVAFRQVPIDPEAVVRDVAAAGMPHGDTFTAGRRLQG